MERTIDLVARTLGLEPAEVRRRNMIRADEMPYRVGIPYRDGEPIVYDSGDYPGALAEGARRDRRRRGVPPRQARGARATAAISGSASAATSRAPASGRSRARWCASIPSGKVYVSSGACPQGQGMETIFAQIVADLWKVAPEDVVMSLADTAAIAIGFGTMASRSTVTVSAAIHHASERLRDKVFAIAANLLECAPADLELRDGGVGVVGVPGATVSLAEAGAGGAARLGPRPPARGRSRAGGDLLLGAADGHLELCRARRDRRGRPRAPAGSRIEDYAVAHDCGVVVNPMLVEGQIMGGAAQGLGGILCEAIAYDAKGQLLTGSLMDYALPTASDIPAMQIVHQHSPSPLNPLGVKGVGEGGAVAPPAAIANAVCDALAPFGVEINATPIRREQLAKVTRSPRALSDFAITIALKRLRVWCEDAMLTHEWRELEVLCERISDLRHRYVAAQRTKNVGLIEGLKDDIAKARRQRELLVQYISARLGSRPPTHDPTRSRRGWLGESRLPRRLNPISAPLPRPPPLSWAGGIAAVAGAATGAALPGGRHGVTHLESEKAGEVEHREPDRQDQQHRIQILSRGVEPIRSIVALCRDGAAVELIHRPKLRGIRWQQGQRQVLFCRIEHPDA